MPEAEHTAESARIDVDRWSRHLWHTSQHNNMPIFLGVRLQEQANAMRISAGLKPLGWVDSVPDVEFGECSVHSDGCAGQESRGRPSRRLVRRALADG